MYLINNNLAVVREFQIILSKSELYQYDVPYNRNFFSEVFEIMLGENKTKWKIVLGFECENLRVSLLKLESISDEFSINLMVQAYPKRNGQLLNLHYKDPYFQDKHTCHVMNTRSDFFSKNQCDNLLLMFKIELIEKSPESKFFPLYEGVPFESLHDNAYSDFSFLCSDGQIIHAHRFVIAAGSPVMKAMLETPMAESKSSIAEISDIDGSTMMELLRFMYTGQVDNLELHAPNLLYCAEKYGLNGLKSLCSKLMIQNISLGNVLEYFNLAKRYNEVKLLKRCAIFIKTNYKKVKKIPEWERLDLVSTALIDLLAENENKSVQVLSCF